MKKIIIIGCPGSGKSTLARKLAHILDLSLVHLDMLNWKEDRTVVERTVFLARLQKALAQDSWIIDGNYGSTLEIRFAACDTVIFLDYPLDICLTGIKERLGTARPDMPWVESEMDEEFLDFVKTFSETNRPIILQLLKKYSEKTCLIFKNRAEADCFLETMKKELK